MRKILLNHGGIVSPKLFLFGKDDAGLLKFQLPDGQLVKVLLDGRQTKVLLVLNDALQEDVDGDLDEEIRGWITDSQIAEAVARRDEFYIATSAQTIAAYRSQIKHRILDATPPGYSPPTLLVTKRCLGVRLAEEIIVDRLDDRRYPTRPDMPP